jgi:hypothetical protein
MFRCYQADRGFISLILPDALRRLPETAGDIPCSALRDCLFFNNLRSKARKFPCQQGNRPGELAKGAAPAPEQAYSGTVKPKYHPSSATLTEAAGLLKFGDSVTLPDSSSMDR